MKTWQLNRRVNGLSEDLADSVKTETRIDFNCLSEPERQLLDRVQEIIDKYPPASPPRDVIDKNADLWNKGLEIFARRTLELFVEVMPPSLCCDELEKWYFKLISTISGLTGLRAFRRCVKCQRSVEKRFFWNAEKGDC
jgi:hypothetical protein